MFLTALAQLMGTLEKGSKGFQHLCKEIDHSPDTQQSETLTIIDGSAIFYTLTNIPGNFQQISDDIFSHIPP